MNKSKNEIIFENEDHRKCHQTLMEILKNGTLKPNLGMIVRLTKGVSQSLFKPQCINSFWKIEFISLVKQEAQKWEKEGGTVGEKLRQTLQKMVNAEEQILPKWICDKAGVEQWYLRKYNLKYQWQKDLYRLVKKEQLKWEKNGGNAFKLGIEALKNITISGERPSIKTIALKMGKNPSYLHKKSYIWQKRLIKNIERADYQWKQKGGKYRRLFNKILNEYIQKGIRPQINTICDEINYNSTNILKPHFFWQRTIKNNIINAEKYWLTHGGSNATKCKIALIQIVKEGKKPTQNNVLKKAGFGSSFLKRELNEWKIKILNLIERKASKGLDKINIIYIDINSLINKEIIKNYHKIGIIIKSEKTDIYNYFILSKIMYDESHIIKYKTRNSLYANKNTFKEKRKVYIDGIINACEGIKYSLIITLIPRMIKAALWLGDNIPVTLNDAKKSFFEYSIFLRKKIKSTELSNSVANQEQLAITKLLAGMFNVDYDEIIKDNRSLLIPQKPPRSNAFTKETKFTQKELSYAFNFYFSLFNQITNFLLNKENFPHIIQLPRGSAIILGVGQNLIVPSYNLPKQQCIGIDYLDGHILDDTELKNLAIKKNKIKRIYCYYQNRKIIQNNLFILNNNSNHAKRLALGKKALDAWFMCMLYLTSTNDSTLSLYEWTENDEYETIKDERKEFITIKPRANNKTIRFTIPKVFMPYFVKALELRKFVLNGEKFPYLFFHVGNGEKSRTSRTQYAGGMSSDIANYMINSIDNQLPKITSRIIRKDGSKDAITSHGIETALSVLQNTENTLINNYNGFTQEELSSQIINFLEIIHENVINDDPIDNKKQTAMGGCNSEDQLTPQTINNDNNIKANCDDFKSCIFCRHFITFPSPNEIRKLLSLKYLIENVAYNRTNDDIFFDKKMKPWIKRIETIFNVMIEKYPESKKIIDDILLEVYQDGSLSPYWLDWVIDLNELGRLS